MPAAKPYYGLYIIKLCINKKSACTPITCHKILIDEKISLKRLYTLFVFNWNLKNYSFKKLSIEGSCQFKLSGQRGLGWDHFS